MARRSGIASKNKKKKEKEKKRKEIPLREW